MRRTPLHIGKGVGRWLSARIAAGILLGIPLCGVWHAGPVCAEVYRTGENQVKAAFIFNFASFVEWPPAAFADGDSSFRICILGNDSLGGALDSLKGKTIKGRKVLIKKCSSTEDARNCHILFISNSERKRASSLARSLRGSHVLTVGDEEGFCEAGGMINLVRIKNRVGFEINVAAAQLAGLRISSHLLKLARDVID